jgi:hypothetical protein
MLQVLTLGELSVDVFRKDIKNLHLSVHPPTGRVRIAAPQSLGLDAIRAFAISRMSWIRKSQKRLQTQRREPPREYLDRESHYVWGERVLLRVTTHYAPPLVRLKHRTLVLKVRPRSSLAERQGLVEKWYRDLLRQEAEVAIERWSARLGVSPRRLFVQRMKTKWGSCNPKTGYVRFNTDLAKKPRECLDYVVLHELAHLIERTHSDGFFDILDRNMPQWREVRRLLNDLPVSTPPV